MLKEEIIIFLNDVRFTAEDRITSQEWRRTNLRLDDEVFYHLKQK